MNKLYKRFDSFCARHYDKGIPNLMIFVSIGIALVYVFQYIDPSNAIYNALCFDRTKILHGQVWRMLTYIFIPEYSGVLWLVIGLYFYYVIGKILERDWGTLRFNIFYVTGVLITSVAGLLLKTNAVYATYINFSLFLAYASLYPDNMVLVFFIIPLKMKYLAWAYLALTALEVIGGYFPGNLLPLFALLNYVLFFWPNISNLFGRTKTRYSKQSRDFRRQSDNIRRQQNAWAANAKVYSNPNSAPKAAPTAYRHKCHICGKTDVEYPDLDFRYCSRCNGYYCYCPDHINNHQHIQ